MTRIKICGITDRDDAMQAVELGADAVGFVFADSSRRIDPAAAREIALSLPPFVDKVGVFVNEERSKVRELFSFCLLTVVQLHGKEEMRYMDSLHIPVIKAFRVKDAGVLEQIRAYNLPYFLLDTYDGRSSGGTGRTFDWNIAREASRFGRVILSGGLNHANVSDALSSVRPYAVDVSSGVESSPGRKDPLKLKRFINEVRTWDSRAG